MVKGRLSGENIEDNVRNSQIGLKHNRTQVEADKR